MRKLVLNLFFCEEFMALKRALLLISLSHFSEVAAPVKSFIEKYISIRWTSSCCSEVSGFSFVFFGVRFGGICTLTAAASISWGSGLFL